MRRGIVGCHVEDLRKDARGARTVAFGQNAFAHFDQRGDLDRARGRLALDRELREQLVENRLQLTFGARVGQVRDRLALKDRIDGRDRLDLELAGDEAIRIDVDLDQHNALVGIIRGDLFEHRTELLARAAPFGPEIEDDEAGHRGFDDVAAEGFDGFLFGGIQTERGHADMLLF